MLRIESIGQIEDSEQNDVCENENETKSLGRLLLMYACRCKVIKRKEWPLVVIFGLDGIRKKISFSLSFFLSTILNNDNQQYNGMNLSLNLPTIG